VLSEVPNPSKVLRIPSTLLTTSNSICSTPEPSTPLPLNAALADDDELRAVGENGALPRTECPEMFEFTGKFNAYTAFIGAVEYAEFLVRSVPVV